MDPSAILKAEEENNAAYMSLVFITKFEKLIRDPTKVENINALKDEALGETVEELGLGHFEHYNIDVVRNQIVRDKQGKIIKVFDFTGKGGSAAFQPNDVLLLKIIATYKTAIDVRFISLLRKETEQHKENVKEMEELLQAAYPALVAGNWNTHVRNAVSTLCPIDELAENWGYMKRGNKDQQLKFKQGSVMLVVGNRVHFSLKRTFHDQGEYICYVAGRTVNITNLAAVPISPKPFKLDVPTLQLARPSNVTPVNAGISDANTDRPTRVIVPNCRSGSTRRTRRAASATVRMPRRLSYGVEEEPTFEEIAEEEGEGDNQVPHVDYTSWVNKLSSCTLQ